MQCLSVKCVFRHRIDDALSGALVVTFYAAGFAAESTGQVLSTRDWYNMCAAICRASFDPSRAARRLPKALTCVASVSGGSGKKGLDTLQGKDVLSCTLAGQ